MDPLRRTATQWLAGGEPAVLVEVTRALGSAPREAGTRMLVSAARCAGTVGGGHLELKAIEQARQMLAAGSTGPLSVHYPLGPALGQCCGGAVTLGFAAFDAAALAAWPQRAPRLHLQLYGAGHVGRAIVMALAPLNVRIDWIDERDAEFPPDDELPEGVRKVCVDAVEAEVDEAPPGTFYLVLTHRHDLDLRLALAILKRGDAGFFGLIGSKTKRARFIRRFETYGLPPAAIARMTCPIGVPGIAGKEPEVIAASVAAQLLQASSAAARGHRSAEVPADAPAQDEATTRSAPTSCTLTV
ncbi:xanthine dehydrogenase accessory protein XdhC [Piscinibacter defluvii]|uniref:xanthine dehydrogenase accessory protein XdhC n=1 Tax=Piscinibacter defluvii TaxID=1796922 RepID=UPI000FDE8F08|nr:xanthine dehydrogenase accessory protein XdhC [Piscinibacter defluvii]